jgi:hypothetical protein
MFWIGLCLGIIIGVAVGIVVLALCQMAANDHHMADVANRLPDYGG